MKDKSYYKSLPLNLRKQLRAEQEEELCRTFVREFTKLSLSDQIDIESDYLLEENRLLYKKLTNDDEVLLDFQPECFILLGELARELPPEQRAAVTVMTYDQLMRGYERYKRKSPRRKKNQCDFEIEHIIVNMALQNVTWSELHILSMLRDLGFEKITPSQIERILRRNQIPNTYRRMAAGISWRDFMSNLKNKKLKGVIIQ